MKTVFIFSLCLSLFFLSHLSALSKHTGPSYDSNARNALDKYAEPIAKQYQLKLISSGLGSLVDEETGLWALHFTSCKKVTLDEARPVAEKLAEKLLTFMYANPLFTDYFNHHNPRKRVLSLVDMGYKIAFWDENVDRPHPPYLAEIRLRNGQIYYYFADPKTQKLQEPLIEPLKNLPEKAKSH